MIRQASGIVGDVRGLAHTGLRAVRTRLELASIELSEEKAWLVRFVLVAVASLYLITFGLLLGICALTLWASEQNRPAILGACTAVFLVVGIGCAVYIRLQARRRHPIFAETIAVLKGDEQALRQSLQGAGDD
ncbi:MAG TPA: phage holin family protein [Usitatibacter sp.]|nr:phage holin family protein [Usitatibacter sp.]